LGNLGGSGHEAVANAGLAEKVARLLGILLDLSSQAGDVDVQVVGFGAVFRAPDGAQEHGVGEDLIRPTKVFEMYWSA
jgi:hypothetical protein